MGLPPEDDAIWADLMNKILGAGDPDINPEGTQTVMERDVPEIFRRCSELIAARRANPTDDLTSVLVHAEIDGETLEEHEIVMGFFLLMAAGNDSTKATYCSGMRALLEDPEQRQLLLDDPSLIASAVEESLRMFPAFAHFRRTAMADSEINGTPIREGDKVVMWYVSSGRDETRYEDPDRFDVTRNPEHQAFGAGGRHFCLGAALARLELRVLFEETLARYPKMEFAGTPEYVESAVREPAQDAARSAWRVGAQLLRGELVGALGSPGCVGVQSIGQKECGMRRFGLMTGLVLCLGFPAAAGAASPTVTTGGATSVNRTTAVLNARINPQGQRTVYYFQFGVTNALRHPDGDQVRRLGHVDGGREDRADEPHAGHDLPLPRGGPERRRDLFGADRRFKTTGQPPAPPGVFTGGTTGRNLHGATLTGVVASVKSPATYRFQFGLTPAYGIETTSSDRSGPAVSPARELRAHRPAVPSDLPLPPRRHQQGRHGGRRRPALHLRARASGPGDAQHAKAPPQRPPLGAEDDREAEHSARLPRPPVVHGNRAGPIPHRPQDRPQHHGADRWRLPVRGLDGHQRPARGLAAAHRAAVPGQCAAEAAEGRLQVVRIG